eukprot:2503157-Pyramimonas_sp.AAC.1
MIIQGSPPQAPIMLPHEVQSESICPPQHEDSKSAAGADLVQTADDNPAAGADLFQPNFCESQAKRWRRCLHQNAFEDP